MSFQSVISIAKEKIRDVWEIQEIQFRSENQRSSLQVNDILNLDLKNDRS